VKFRVLHFLQPLFHLPPGEVDVRLLPGEEHPGRLLFGEIVPDGHVVDEFERVDQRRQPLFVLGLLVVQAIVLDVVVVVPCGDRIAVVPGVPVGERDLPGHPVVDEFRVRGDTGEVVLGGVELVVAPGGVRDVRDGVLAAVEPRRHVDVAGRRPDRDVERRFDRLAEPLFGGRIGRVHRRLGVRRSGVAAVTTVATVAASLSVGVVTATATASTSCNGSAADGRGHGEHPPARH